jgi:hypothetical protein
VIFVCCEGEDVGKCRDAVGMANAVEDMMER